MQPANECLSKGDFEGALAALEEAEATAQAFALRARAWAGLRRLDKALEAVQKSLELDSTNADANNVMGAILLGEDKAEESLRFFDQAIAVEPTSFRAYFNRARAHLALERLEEAAKDVASLGELGQERLVEVLSEALTQATEKANTVRLTYSEFKKRCYDQIAAGDGGGAFETLKCWLEANPGQLTEATELLDLFLNTRLAAETAHLMKACLDREPAQPMAWVVLGSVLSRPEEVLSCLRKTLEYDDPEAMFEAAALACSWELYAEAMELIEPALERDDTDFRFLHTKGLILQETQQLKEAIEYYTLSIEANPGTPESYNNRGNCYRDLAQYEEALECYKGALQVAPDDFDTLYNHGTTLMRLARFEEAVQSLEKATESNPGHGGARYHLGLSLFQKGEVEKAESHYELACQCDPSYFERPYKLLRTAVSGPPKRYRSGRDWHAAYEELQQLLTTHQAFGKSYRVDFKKGHYFWEDGEQLLLRADCTVLATYSDVSWSFMAGWLNEGFTVAAPQLENLEGLVGRREGLSFEQGWELALDIADRLPDLTAVLSVRSGQLTYYLGLKGVRQPDSREELEPFGEDRAVEFMSNKIAALLAELESQSLSLENLQGLFLDFSQRASQQAEGLYRDTELGARMTEGGREFERLGRILMDPSPATALRLGPDAELSESSRQECREGLLEMQRIWSSTSPSKS